MSVTGVEGRSVMELFEVAGVRTEALDRQSSDEPSDSSAAAAMAH